MLKKILNDVNVNIEKPFSLLLTSKCAVGKTTFNVLLAYYFLFKERRNVLYITNDKESYAYQKMMEKLGSTPISSFGKNQWMVIHSIDKIIEIIDKLYNKNDVVIIDDTHLFIFNKEKLHEIVFELKKRSISTIVSVPSILNVMTDTYDPSNPLYEPKDKKMALISDYVISIEKKKIENSFINTIKKIFLFWKPQSNIVLRVIKNRYSNNKSINLNIDFEKLKIK